MRTSILSRFIVAGVSLGVASVLVTVSPASAAVGQWDDYTDHQFQAMALNACSGDGASFATRAAPELDAVLYEQSGDLAETLLISATVDRDGQVDEHDQYDFDATCTFAVIATSDEPNAKYGSGIEGSYSLTADSAADAAETARGAFSQVPSATTTPVFTDVDEYANASLVVSGHRITLKDGTVTIPGIPKRADVIAGAAKVRDGRIKKAKATYAKAKKKAAAIDNARKRAKAKKKAKKVYSREISQARQTYAMRIAPSPARTGPGAVTVRTPFSLNLTL